MTHAITVVTPTIPPRRNELTRALGSVFVQTHPAAAVAVAYDHERGGAWACRQAALDMARTDWIAFLDDDDELMPHHLATCVAAQVESDADVIVPWFNVVGGFDPFPGNRAVQFDPADVGVHSFGITCLVRRAAIGAIRFRERVLGVTPAEDAMFWMDLHAAGARFHKVTEATWTWHHHGRNTSGRADAW